MTSSEDLVLVGRSSSHFTRTARVFALELGVAHRFHPVLDMTTLDVAAYAGNPALKVPILVDGRGPLYGTENICRELTRRSGLADRVVLRGDISNRLVANAEELVLHAMNTGVALVMSAIADKERPLAPKVRPSLENTLAFLDTNIDGILAALPADRALSFVEASLFCCVTHLPFRGLLDVSGYSALSRFSTVFATRPGARATEYHFDSPA
jgi:glutathione S-transferase